jgi:predicted secreted acid phosphatase
MVHPPRARSPRMLAVVAAVVVTLVGAGIAIGSSVNAIHIFTPKSESQVTNIDILRSELKAYYGDPTAATGPNGGWHDALNLGSNYAKEAAGVAAQAGAYLAAKAGKSSMQAIVLDVDDTTLTTFNYELFSNWDYNPGTNAIFVGLTGSTFTGNIFPAAPGMLDMVWDAYDAGYAVFFITGRGDSQHNATIANLVSDVAAGYSDIVTVDHTLTGLSTDVPDIDAGYPMPTPVEHGAFVDGLFTKPAVGNYPEYLNKPEFCADAIAASKSCATIAYKSGTRAYIESLGYDIVASFGDQFSDLLGGYADKTFKMPNPNYYLP